VPHVLGEGIPNFHVILNMWPLHSSNVIIRTIQFKNIIKCPGAMDSGYKYDIMLQKKQVCAEISNVSGRITFQSQYVALNI